MDGDTQQCGASFRGNITFDPLAPALAVDDPAIQEVLDCDTGEFLDARTWIGNRRYEELIVERVGVRERLAGQPRFRCSLCSVPAYLVSNQFKHFFFRHVAEDGSCPAETRSPLSRDEILARKYHGMRESEPHKRIKALIARSLLADPAFSNILSEHQWRSSHDPRSRRQPDVQATGPMGRVAFEVQLSTTFLDVVVGRRAFYRQEGALLVWVMGRFDPDYRRLTTDDLLFSNNSNILVVDEESASISEAARRFHVRCYYRRPVRQENRLTDAWESHLVPFDELTFETDAQRCWHADYAGQAAAIRTAIEEAQKVQARAAADALRDELIAFWTARMPNSRPDENARRAWSGLRLAFVVHGIGLPQSPDDDSGFMALMNGLTSAKEGRPIGWNFRHLIEVAHRIADGYPQHVVAFGHVIRHFEQEKLLDGQDGTGKWKRRATAIGRSLRDDRPDFLPDRATLPLILFLYPAIGEKVRILAARSAPT